VGRGRPKGIGGGLGRGRGATVDEDEDEHGPEGDKMPRPSDLPSYTLFGQVLKRMG